jgi:hypothetical protein
MRIGRRWFMGLLPGAAAAQTGFWRASSSTVLLPGGDTVPAAAMLDGKASISVVSEMEADCQPLPGNRWGEICTSTGRVGPTWLEVDLDMLEAQARVNTLTGKPFGGIRFKRGGKTAEIAAEDIMRRLEADDAR